MRKIAVVVCLLSLAFAACGKDDSPTVDATPKPTVINVEATDSNGTYKFGVDATAEVDNLASIVVKNTGQQPHQAALIKIADGKTLDDAKAFLSAEGSAAPAGPPPFTVGGGTTVIDPGGSATVTQSLPAGSYAFFCFVPGPDRAPHFVKGMTAAITITGTSTASLPLPEGENATASEYKYDLPALKAGTTVLRTTNAGKQDHEFQLGRLADGKTAADALAWLNNPQGPPPMASIAGPVVGVGGSNSFKLTLQKGTYVVFCRIPDQTDGKPHFQHGMFQGFTIT
ncbi:MAG: hypothetical protein QOJ00_1514 [Actinomycetota bacterium]